MFQDYFKTTRPLFVVFMEDRSTQKLIYFCWHHISLEDKGEFYA